MSEKKFLKKLAATGATFLAFTGLLLNGMFTDPADIAKKEAYTPQTIVSTVVTTAVPEEDEEEPGEDEKKEKKTFLSKIRAWILRLPLGLRVFVGIPLWAAGWGLSQLFGFLFTTFIAPNAGTIVKWLITAAVIAGVFLLLSRIVSPEKKLKEILNKRTAAVLAGGVVLMAVLNGLLPFVWEDFEKAANLIRLLSGAAVVAALGITVMIPKKGKR